MMFVTDPFSFAGGALGTAFAGGSPSDILKGGLKGALFGGISGAAFGYIGGPSELGGAGFSFGEKVAAHALTGGVLSDLQGGKFGHGFISAGITKISSGTWINNFKTTEVRTIAAAITGGTVSKITGGKFANGASTAAFAHYLNQEVENRLRKMQLNATGRVKQSVGRLSTVIASTDHDELDRMALSQNFSLPGSIIGFSSGMDLTSGEVFYELAMDLELVSVSTEFMQTGDPQATFATGDLSTPFGSFSAELEVEIENFSHNVNELSRPQYHLSSDGQARGTFLLYEYFRAAARQAGFY